MEGSRSSFRELSNVNSRKEHRDHPTQALIVQMGRLRPGKRKPRELGGSGSMLMLQEHWARRKGNPGWTTVLPLPRSATLGKSPCSLGLRCLPVSCGRWPGCQPWALLALSLFSWKQDSLTTPAPPWSLH